ncbi:MAG: helix-turn-helix domain-containing protein [Caldilineaceae bacterium]
MNEQNPDSTQPIQLAKVAPTQWLTLKEASDFLGIHYTTLRTWADQGEIAVFRTPGGHRRFSLADLRRFLDERGNHANQQNALVLVEAAIDRTRHAIQHESAHAAGWQYPLTAEAGETRRTRGRKLFTLAIAYVLKPAQRERTLQEAVALGHEYGYEAAVSGVTLAATGKAVQFFRGQLLQTLSNPDGTAKPDADDLRIHQLIDQFLDEVLYAVLNGFESNVLHLAQNA